MKILDVVILLLSVANAQKDLSLNGTPSQSSDYYWIQKQLYLTADLAISGTQYDTFNDAACSVTLPSPPQSVAWWIFTFPVNTLFITNVKINYRHNFSARLAGYSLYVSNSSTSKTDGYLCYHDEGPGLPSVYQNRNCNHLGQYVIIYNERTASVNYPDVYYDYAILELCKVRIYGCYKGWWGSDCSNTCPATCVVGHCDPGNGSCVWGCNPENCVNDMCDTATGKCTDGCKIGLRGDYCDKECEEGNFGNNCAETCNCVNQPCYHITGECPPGGCQRGYTESRCSVECSVGSYGYSCSQSCHGCLSDSCDTEYGVCENTTGCKPGWQYVQSGQQKCDIVCNDGYFGMNCMHQCHCRYGYCIKDTGICPTQGCQRGWKGDTCSEGCSSGDHGFDCVDRCNTCISTLCERFEGNCTDGCIEGYTGHQCLISVPPSSPEPPTHNIGPIAGGIGAVVVATVLLVIFIRYILGKTDGVAKKQNRETSNEYVNSIFTNDYANIGNYSTETHYEETIPSAHEHTYDTI